MKLKNIKRVALIYTIYLIGLSISIIINFHLFEIYYLHIDKLFKSYREINVNLRYIRYLYAYILWMMFSGSVIVIIITPFANKKISVPLIIFYTVIQIFYFYGLYFANHETCLLIFIGSFPTIISIYLNFYVVYSHCKFADMTTPSGA